MKRELLRVEPWSAVRVGFFLGFVGGVLLGLLEGAAIKMLADVAGNKLLPPEAGELINMGGGGLLLVAIVSGLFLSLVSALMGALFAIFYNWIARLFGGLEIALDDPPAPETSETSDGNDDHE